MRVLLILALLAAPAAARDPNAVTEGVDALANSLAPQEASERWRRVAVLPFEALDPGAAELRLGRISGELLSARLSGRPGVLLVERARIDSVVSELQRKEAGQLAPEGAANVGRLLGVSSVVLGSVATAGSDYLLTARIVDTETGQVLTAADHSVPQAGMVALSEDVVEFRSRFGAAARSAAAPGWGQIYNGDTGRGTVYLGAFVGLGAGAITTALLGAQAESRYQENTPGTVDQRAAASDYYQQTNWLLVGLGATWLLSVVDAYLTGEDVVTVDVRAIGGRF